jgi:hypothetical protein
MKLEEKFNEKHENLRGKSLAEQQAKMEASGLSLQDLCHKVPTHYGGLVKQNNWQPLTHKKCHSVSSIQYQSYTPGNTTASLSETHKINRAPTKNNDSVTPQRCSNDYNCRLS